MEPRPMDYMAVANGTYAGVPFQKGEIVRIPWNVKTPSDEILVPMVRRYWILRDQHYDGHLYTKAEKVAYFPISDPEPPAEAFVEFGSPEALEIFGHHG